MTAATPAEKIRNAVQAAVGVMSVTMQAHDTMRQENAPGVPMDADRADEITARLKSDVSLLVEDFTPEDTELFAQAVSDVVGNLLEHSNSALYTSSGRWIDWSGLLAHMGQQAAASEYDPDRKPEWHQVATIPGVGEVEIDPETGHVVGCGCDQEDDEDED